MSQFGRQNNNPAAEFRTKDFLKNLRFNHLGIFINPGSMELELTESVLMKSVESTKSVLFAVADTGIKLAVKNV